MANRPVNTGWAAAAPRHRPSTTTPPPPPRLPRHRAARSTRAARTTRAARGPRPSKLAWLPYLIVLAGTAAGLLVVWAGSKYAGRGASLIGASLLAAALARLILPARYVGLLATRRKASDVLGFAVFGAAVLAVAIALP